MSHDTIIAGWMDPDKRGTDASAHPAGELPRMLDASELAAVVGGDCGPGSFFTITGECTCPNGITVCSWSGCC